MKKVLSIESFQAKVKVATKDAQIKAAHDELDRILGAIYGWEQGTIKVDAIALLDMIKEDILDFTRRGEKP
jgi:predicted RNase H-like nuclease